MSETVNLCPLAEWKTIRLLCPCGATTETELARFQAGPHIFQCGMCDKTFPQATAKIGDLARAVHALQIANTIGVAFVAAPPAGK